MGCPCVDLLFNPVCNPLLRKKRKGGGGITVQFKLQVCKIEHALLL